MYEYKVLQTDSLINEIQLNELSLEGWRFVTVAQCGSMYYFYFEKLMTSSKALPFNVLRKF